jgi:hypothetical protein
MRPRGFGQTPAGTPSCMSQDIAGLAAMAGTAAVFVGVGGAALSSTYRKECAIAGLVGLAAAIGGTWYGLSNLFAGCSGTGPFSSNEPGLGIFSTPAQAVPTQQLPPAGASYPGVEVGSPGIQYDPSTGQPLAGSQGEATTLNPGS